MYACRGIFPSSLSDVKENALLEAGRERVGMEAVLYCNTYDICDRD
jgi:hypothetical protein